MQIQYDETTAFIKLSKTELRHLEHLATWGMFALDCSIVTCPKAERAIASELLAVGKAMHEGQEGERNYESEL